MEPPYLHYDIIYEILLRISSVALGRCRVASKEWNKLTYDSKFKKNLSEKNNIVDGFFVQELIERQYVTSFSSISNGPHKISLDFIQGSNVRMQAVSATNGIILYTSDNPEQYHVPRFFVCKLQTQVSQQIPNPRTRFMSVGVAIYILSSNPLRYKILRISTPKLFVRNCQQLILEIFDSEVWKWKRLKDILLPYNNWFLGESAVVTACGAFHWLLHKNILFSFDIEEEEWKITHLPIVEDKFRSIDATEYEGKLALICMDEEDYMHMWVLESYMNWIWEKRFVINMKEPDSTYLAYSPVGFYSSDIVVVRGLQSLKYYDFKNTKILYETKLEKHYNPNHIFPFWSDSEPCCLKRAREVDFQCSSRKRKKPNSRSRLMEPSVSI